jgi:hypothetical protein
MKLKTALSVMRKEYPEMRKMLVRTMGLLKSHDIDIPKDLGREYEDVVGLDLHDLQDK